MTREEAIQCIKHELLITVNRKDLTGQAIGEALDMAIEALQAESDRPQGEWIGVDGEPYSMCSNCERYIDDIDDDFDFCPHGGAKMQGEE